jgi:replicative DNA helicase
MDWESLSEMTFGLLLKGKITSDAVRSDLFCEPYAHGVNLYKEGHNEVEYLIARLGITPIQAAMEASNQINGNKFDCVGMLERAYLQSQLAGRLENSAKKLRRGEDVEFAQIVEQFNLLDNRQNMLVPMSEITPIPAKFQLCGWDAIDTVLGGLPESGLVTVGGSPGAGKTSFLIKLITNFLTVHPEKMAAMFTLEMPSPEFVNRAFEIHEVSKDVQKRFLIDDRIMPVEDVANEAMKYNTQIGIVGVDFADLMIKNETSESEMATIYLTLASLAKRLHCPVILLSQLNRQYVGGLPRPTYLRYTSLAESVSWDIWMLYNPNTDFHTGADEGTLPTVDEMGYLLSWKQRGGWRREFPGPAAIQLAWDGQYAWGSESKGHFLLKT